MGGKKQHNPNREDIWCIRYLSKFTWEHLNERTHSDERIRAAKLKSELTLVKKESAFYLEQVELGKKIEKMQEKKEKKAHSADKGKQRERREFTQRKPILKEISWIDKNLKSKGSDDIRLMVSLPSRDFLITSYY